MRRPAIYTQGHWSCRKTRHSDAGLLPMIELSFWYSGTCSILGASTRYGDVIVVEKFQSEDNQNRSLAPSVRYEYRTYQASPPDPRTGANHTPGRKRLQATNQKAGIASVCANATFWWTEPQVFAENLSYDLRKPSHWSKRKRAEQYGCGLIWETSPTTFIDRISAQNKTSLGSSRNGLKIF